VLALDRLAAGEGDEQGSNQQVCAHGGLEKTDHPTG
jgi:hypothetical protein